MFAPPTHCFAGWAKVRDIKVNVCSVGDEEGGHVESWQNGWVSVRSDDGGKASQEFCLFFNLVIATELVRVIKGRLDEPAWQGLRCPPAALGTSLCVVVFLLSHLLRAF